MPSAAELRLVAVIVSAVLGVSLAAWYVAVLYGVLDVVSH